MSLSKNVNTQASSSGSHVKLKH